MEGPRNNLLLPLVVFIGYWSTSFTEAWGRREKELAFVFDIDQKIDNEVHIRPGFRGRHDIDPVTKKVTRVNTIKPWQRRIFTELPTLLIGGSLYIASFLLVDYL